VPDLHEGVMPLVNFVNNLRRKDLRTLDLPLSFRCCLPGEVSRIGLSGSGTLLPLVLGFGIVIEPEQQQTKAHY